MNCLRSLGHWDRGFESHSRHGCLYVLSFCVCVVLCVGSSHATGWSLIQGAQLTVYRITKLKKRPGPNEWYGPIAYNGRRYEDEDYCDTVFRVEEWNRVLLFWLSRDSMKGYMWTVYSGSSDFSNREFKSRWGHWIFFNWPNPSSRTMALGSTQPLTEMSTGN
jgi:hypothetical protein